MKKIFTAIIFVIFLLSINNSANAQSKIQFLDSLFQVANREGIFNGNVLVAENGTILYKSEIGYADASKTKNLTSGSRFNIGSISKAFSAVVIMKLKEQGKLNFNDKVSTFIENLPEWSNQITIRHLLEYSSGMPNVDYQNIFSDEDAWQALKKLPHLEFEPGTHHIYSNYNIFLRERIIEKISGQPYSGFLTSTILAPCGMKNVILDPPPTAPALARAFDNKFIADDFPTSMSGAMYATINDLYQWTKCLQNYEIISKSSFLELAAGNKTVGMVRTVDNDWTVYYHHGSSYNFESSVYVNSQDEFTVVLMTNNKNFNVGDLTNASDAILREEHFEVPKKSFYMALRTEIYYNGVESGKELYEYIIGNQQEHYDLSNIERDLYKTGQYLIGKNKISYAVNTLEFAVSVFPDSWNTHLILGNAYQLMGKTGLAFNSYTKALELNPENKVTKAKIERLR